MSKDTPIEWCDSSVNPVMGCEGCELWIPGKIEHCYAGTLHKIRAGRPGYADKFEVPKMFPGRMAVAANWAPLSDPRPDKPWLSGPRKIFISDMGDALSRDVPLEYLRDEVIGAVNSDKGQRHHWLWLTKQPARMVKLAEMIGTWPANLWAMTSVTSQEQLGRIKWLMRVPAKVRGVSYEPALGKVDFGPHLPKRWCDNCYPGHGHDPVEHRKSCRCLCHMGIDWLIVGGESGPAARLFAPIWAKFAMLQCSEAGVPVFVKQLGSVYAKTNGFHDKKGGDWSEWPADLRIREFPR